jgi:hypothetical protein
VRLADWPRMPFLNDELREWLAQHLAAIHAEDAAVYAVADGREEEARRVLVVTEAGLVDGWYAPHDSSARYSLSIRLFPWASVGGVDLRAQTTRLWAHEHETQWIMRLGNPVFATRTDDPLLGAALAEFGAACAVMAVGESAAVAGNPGAEAQLPEWLTRRQRERAEPAPADPGAGG